ICFAQPTRPMTTCRQCCCFSPPAGVCTYIVNQRLGFFHHRMLDAKQLLLVPRISLRVSARIETFHFVLVVLRTHSSDDRKRFSLSRQRENKVDTAVRSP